MTGAVQLQLLEVIERLNRTITTDEQLSEDMALNVLEDFRDEVRSEMKAEIEALP